MGNRHLWCLVLAALCLSLAWGAERYSEFVGQPKFEEGEDLAYYVWKTGDTWHVRWTTFGSMRHFNGRVHVTGGEIESLKRIDVDSERRVIRPGHPSRIVVGPRGRARVVGGRAPVIAQRDQDRIEKENDRLIRFSARTDDDVDGFDFKVDDDSTQLRFVLEIDGVSRTDRVRIGPYARRPESNPFMVNLR